MIAPGNHWILDLLRGAPPRRPVWMIALSNQKRQQTVTTVIARPKAVAIRNPCDALHRPAPVGTEGCGSPRSLRSLAIFTGQPTTMNERWLLWRGSALIASPGEKLSRKSRKAISVTEEECGRQSGMTGNVKACTMSSDHSESRPEVLFRSFVSRPHSSSDLASLGHLPPGGRNWALPRRCSFHDNDRGDVYLAFFITFL